VVAICPLKTDDQRLMTDDCPRLVACFDMGGEVYWDGKDWFSVDGVLERMCSMRYTIVSMPVAIEQIAAVLRKISREERRRLLDLVPELRDELREQPGRTVSQAQESAEAMRQALIHDLGKEFLSNEAAFLGDLTLGEYLALPDEERALLWKRWAETPALPWTEIDVRTDALPAG